MKEGIAWATVQKMMLDAPQYDIKNDKDEPDIELTTENAEDVANYINSMM
ncbi:MAG: hypothetical protein II401_06690 [Bacteroidales bacterium]|nr:hypothetical protein [Bacteroidales bacterium]